MGFLLKSLVSDNNYNLDKFSSVKWKIMLHANSKNKIEIFSTNLSKLNNKLRAGQNYHLSKMNFIF